MDKFNSVTILLPAMNETYSLQQTVEIILDTCEHKDLKEIIILLNKKFTTKECINIAEQICGNNDTTVPIYIHYQKLPNVGGAIQEGIELAQGSHMVLMSSDLETDPNLIVKFINEAKQNPDMIITASRWMKGCSFEGYNRIKLVCNFVFQKILSILYGTNLTDMTYAFRIFPTDIMKNIKWEEFKHPFFLETALKPLRLKIKFKEIPANWVARSEGESQNSFFANFKYFKTVWHVRFCSMKDIVKN